MERPQWWIFTFGVGHPTNAGKYVRIHGTLESTREKMMDEYGKDWAFQYASEGEAGVQKWKLVLLASHNTPSV